MVSPAYRSLLTSALDSVVERSQDFTDSAYTSHEHRERIILLCDRLKMELHQLLRVGMQLEQINQVSPSEEMEAAIHETLRAARDLKLQRGSYYNVSREWVPQQKPMSRRQVCGRFRQLNAHTERRMVKVIHSNKKATVPQIAGNRNQRATTNVSEQTIRCTLQRTGHCS
ncbi:alpha-catulin [Trichonephila clavipes]|nr:alpha-catulin [Trichonephila clavipes]